MRRGNASIVANEEGIRVAWLGAERMEVSGGWGGVGKVGGKIVDRRAGTAWHGEWGGNGKAWWMGNGMAWQHVRKQPCVWEHTVAIKVTCLCACGTRSAAPTHGAPAHAAPARAAPARAAPARAAPNRAAPTRADPARAAPARAAPARTATTHAAPTLAAPPTSPAAAPRSTPTHPHVHLAQLMARVGMGGAGSRVENRRRGTE
ncbi:unnamed protein product [Closterium sp. NIES-54]